MNTNPKISVIVPAFNEGGRIIKTLNAVKRIDIVSKIYVIDDGSKDDTVRQVEIIEDIILIKNIVNRGKGASLKKGIEEAITTSDIIVFLDADLEESAEEAIKLIYPILEDDADVTIGRFPAAKKKGGFGLVKALARYGVYFNTGIKLNTVLSGQRAFKQEVLRDLSFNYEGYGIELGMTIDILNKGYRVKEVDVTMFHNETSRNIQGFIHRGKQFWHILKVLIKKR
ncbi:glycosyltransferase family 2 protein [Natronincola ferrireducens]|uniref:Glycosyl transferase family 2 n=1 Tax=Natronincola ferrireducens TaxID=393762 RepID=A0A1G9CFE0_9FIRM|nr:glycosyltransferase family 2 protein [Natronincola ferrireducens]SDK50391.1 Glycosyl transferase family 2 [Natronincola ferrireducens]